MLLSVWPTLASGDRVGSMAAGADLCLAAVRADDIGPIAALPGAEMLRAPLPGVRAPGAKGRTGIEVLGTLTTAPMGVFLCTVATRDAQDRATRRALADWGLRMRADLMTRPGAVAMDGRDAPVDIGVAWCADRGGVLALMVGQIEPGGDLRIAVTDRVPGGQAPICVREGGENA